MKMGAEQNKVWFLLDKDELLPYDVTLTQFRERKPIKENIFLELVKKAYDEYGNAYNETAGIINESNDINFVLFAVGRFKIWSDTGVTAPDFVDVCPFITAHILVCCSFHLHGNQIDIAVHS